MSKDFSKFEKRAGLKFKNQDLLKQAFTHRSYLNENPPLAGGLGIGHNERLEFLGDAVLELAVTKKLYHLYPDKKEGELTSIRSALVNTNMLSVLGGEFGFNDFLLLSRGETKDLGRGRQFMLANTFEALVGAIYLDSGFETAESFLERALFPQIQEIVEKSLWQDSKSLFQERAQEIAGLTPNYQVLHESGPDHDKTFVTGVFLNGEKVAEGQGSSKQEAEQAAAQEALRQKGW
ncbi:MAG: Ribonuclease 3 [Parcubacteria group bacterium GW2011_GWB1_41_6]|nr:MAG: Ribonuclease 3 [Parcubacteria group bacterium GW2011_GWB1_41_6]KKS58081.1 MAG: Ribonuclease 3 [Parcubacteria group bacterium GW2011_GWA2_42_35]KKS72632.1 MAG: Ribonuclease 3 [Parcubacteria group bacterium GW2011_GWF2_42_7]